MATITTDEMICSFKNKKLKKIIGGIVLFSAMMNSVFAQSGTPAVPGMVNVGRDGLALEGFDPVSYFTSQKPVKGKKDFNVTLNGITYQFATREHAEMFRSDPAKYG